MNIPVPKLWKIEREIIQLKRELLESEENSFQDLVNKLDPSQLESAIRLITADTRHKITILEVERGFIIDRQSNLFWRLIWNIIVPIIVSLMTIYISFKLGFSK